MLVSMAGVVSGCVAVAVNVSATGMFKSLDEAGFSPVVIPKTMTSSVSSVKSSSNGFALRVAGRYGIDTGLDVIVMSRRPQRVAIGYFVANRFVAESDRDGFRRPHMGLVRDWVEVDPEGGPEALHQAVVSAWSEAFCVPRCSTCGAPLVWKAHMNGRYCGDLHWTAELAPFGGGEGSTYLARLNITPAPFGTTVGDAEVGLTAHQYREMYADMMKEASDLGFSGKEFTSLASSFLEGNGSTPGEWYQGGVRALETCKGLTIKRESPRLSDQAMVIAMLG